MDLSHRPQVLYRASLERIAAAQRAMDDKDYPLSMYLAGLSVECILQAIARRWGASHDARHNLASWLLKCPVVLQDSIKAKSSDHKKGLVQWLSSTKK